MPRRSKQHLLSWVPGTQIGEGNGVNKGIIEPDSSGVGKGLAEELLQTMCSGSSCLFIPLFIKEETESSDVPQQLKGKTKMKTEWVYVPSGPPSL